jgi:hypothetical protein
MAGHQECQRANHSCMAVVALGAWVPTALTAASDPSVEKPAYLSLQKDIMCTKILLPSRGELGEVEPPWNTSLTISP